MKELEEAEARLKIADKIIKKLNLKPLNIPQPLDRNNLKALSQCSKCMKWIRDELYVDHWNECRWTCGICNLTYIDEIAFKKHTWECSRRKGHQ